MTYDYGEPESRNEAILQNMLGAENELLPPESRIEALLIDLLEELQNGGGGGESVIAWKPTVSAEGVISWTRTSSTTKPENQNIKGPAGAAGQNGAAGYSPTVTIQRNAGDNGVIITVTDESGTTTAQVYDGSKITVSQVYTLTAAGWNNKAQTVAIPLNTANRNVIDITLGENSTWDSCGVYPSAETANGITFVCDTVPSTDLTFKVASMEVTS